MPPEPADDSPVTQTPAVGGAAGGTAPPAAGTGRSGTGAPLGGGPPNPQGLARKACEGGRPGTVSGRATNQALPVHTQGLSLRGSRGWVFRDVTLNVPAGELAAVSGIAGSGRTALLLTLGGRMKPSGGTATIGDRGLPRELRAVQGRTALGAIAGVSDLDPALTVREHVSEALALHEGVFGRWRGRKERIRRALDRAGLDLDPGLLAQDLSPDEAQLLGAALGLIGDPGLLLLDDVDEGLPLDRQRALWQRLRGIADTGVTVIATCHDPAPADDLARLVRLPDPRTALPEETPR